MSESATSLPGVFQDEISASVARLIALSQSCEEKGNMEMTMVLKTEAITIMKILEELSKK